MRTSFRLSVLFLLLSVVPLAAQEPAVVSGRVTDAAGAPVAAAQVRIASLNVGALTGADGTYRLIVPGARITPGSAYVVTASRTGLSAVSHSVQLSPGLSVVQNFSMASSALELGGLVVTAQGVSSGQVSNGLSGRSSRIVIRGANSVPAGFNTEEYRHIQENRFHPVASDPRSTFSIDVDRASYSNVRRFLSQGTRPPEDAVRIEEMVNYFAYDYADPADGRPFAVHTEVGAAPWSAGHRLVRVGLQARRPRGEMPASNLVFLLDVSGSMQPENKLPLVQQSMRLLVQQLRPQDRVAIVVYAGAAGLVLDATPGDRPQAIMDAIDRLSAGGSTAGAQGIQLAYQVARRNLIQGGNNRVILATDGDFNVGVSSEGELVRLIERERQDGIYLTVLGVGEGNLADARMEALADHGNGNYAYLDGIDEARKVLVEEVRGTLFTVARDVKIQVEFNPARVASYRLVGYENRMLQDEDFDDDRRDAGEMGAGHAVTAIYEIIPAGAADAEGAAPLRYQRRVPRGRAGDELMFVRVRYRSPEGGASRLVERVVRDRPAAELSADFRWAVAVAEFGMLLRNSEFRGGASVAHVLEEARGAMGGDPGGWRHEFVRLVESYRGLAAAAERGGH